MSIFNSSPWQDDVPFKKLFPQLDKDIECDVCIVGGGIHGITAAYILSKEFARLRKSYGEVNKKVVLLEKETIGSGETSFTTAFISYVIDADIQDLIKKFGEEKSQLAKQSCQRAISFIEETVQEEHIDCEFMRVPLCEYATKEENLEYLKKEVELGKKLGLHVSYKQDEALKVKNKGYMEACCHAKFHPLKYLKALLNKAVENGVELYENTQALEVEGKDSLSIKTNSEYRIKAKYIIAATHAPFNSTLAMQSKLTPWNTYVLAGKVQTDTIPEGLYIDTEDPYHYLRIDKKKGYDQLIYGGEDHETGQEEKVEDRYEKLEESLKELVPEIKFEETHRWGGQVLYSADGLPYIGRLPTNKNQLIGTGYGGDGIPFGTLSALINTDIILGKTNEYEELYDPKRMSGVKELVKQGVNYPKQMLERIFPKHEKGNVNDIPSEGGKVIEFEGRKVAVYKDKDGKVIKLSPVCTHMGCLVNFNDAQKTWDCPCHGSRFNKDGSVLRGPAKKPLEQYK